MKATILGIGWMEDLGRVPDLETTRSYRQKLIDFEKPNYFFVFASIDMGRRRKRFLGLSPKLVPK